MAQKKQNTKVSGLQKQKRRQWRTFVRMVRYGINNFSRNAWLTIAATAVMTVTLLIIFMTFAARGTLLTTVQNIRDQVDMSVYIQKDTPEENRTQIITDLKGLSSVKKVEYISPEKQREDFAEKNKKNIGRLDALEQATNEFSGVLRVNLVDINDVSELENFVKTNENYKVYADGEPSFAGEYNVAIKRIGRWVTFADRAGLAASVVFVVISSLIVFNTIRMAIFNRKEEIQMMKLIGAERNFIRGPFIVEAVVYGFIAALLATGLGVLGLLGAQDTLMEYQVAIEPTIRHIITYIGLILPAMILLGALIGVVSSLLATRRYLKI